jgi:hypothetical protein
VDDQEFYQLLDKNGITDDIHLIQRQAAGVGGLLQLPSPAGSPERAKPVRTTSREDESWSVTRVLGPYSNDLEAPPGFEPGMEVLQTGPGRLSC